MACNNKSTFKRAFFELYSTMKIIPSRLVWVRLQKILSGELLKLYPKTSKILSKNIPQISKKSNKIVGLVESRIIHMDSSLLWRVMPDLWSSCSFFPFSFFAWRFALCWLFTLPPERRKLPDHRLRHANIIHRLAAKGNRMHMFSIHNGTNCNCRMTSFYYNYQNPSVCFFFLCK